jgi:hypothetical protein
MGKSGDDITVRLSDWPEAARPGQSFFHGGGIPESVLADLRRKGYVPIDFRNLEADEKISAMFDAVQNSVYEPSTAQIKALDLHIRALKDKKVSETDDKRVEVLDFLDLLASFASKERPDWAKTSGDVVKTPTSSVSEPEIGANAVADLMKELF